MGSGTVSLIYSYNDDSGTVKSGSVSIPYTAMPPHLYVAQLVGPLYSCSLNGDGTLSSCAATGNGFTAPTGIVFSGNNFAYVTDYYSDAVYVCNAGLNGSLSACVSTGNNFQYPWQLAIDGNTLYATNAHMTGGVTTCAINADGTLSGCSESSGSGTAGVAVNSSYAYIGAGANTVDVCAVGVSGSLSGCAGTGSGFVGLDGITLSHRKRMLGRCGRQSFRLCAVYCGRRADGRRHLGRPGLRE